MPKTTLDIPAQISQAVRQAELQAEIILFGTRGSARPESDWDVLILLDGKVALASEQTLFRLLYEVELPTEEVFSVLIYEKKSDPISSTADSYLSRN